MSTEQPVVVPSAAGGLAGIVRAPTQLPAPGVVFVDGSGEGTKDGWGGWPDWVADCGAVVLRHDKPGCGGSAGDWRDQSFDDRAHESLAAVEVLRSWPGVSERVGLLGISQGGWVALLAAAQASDLVAFVVTISGPGVSPARQERVRLERELRRSGIDGTALNDALAWIDERASRLVAGEPAAQIHAEQEAYAGRDWYGIVAYAYDDPDKLAFAARILAFDPVAVLRQVRCPILALFGGADPLVPVAESVAAIAGALPALDEGTSGLAVLPGADHGLFLASPDPAVPRRDQPAPGFLPMLQDFLRANGSSPSSSG